MLSSWATADGALVRGPAIWRLSFRVLCSPTCLVLRERTVDAADACPWASQNTQIWEATRRYTLFRSLTTRPDSGKMDGPRAPLQEPYIIRVLSWNIDGLDERNLTDRTNAACDVILKEDPDVVYLQEVVPDSAAIILVKFTSDRYQAFFGGEREYFTAVLLKRATCFYDDHRVISFPHTAMGRNLLIVNANVKGIDFALMTTHLESTAEHTAERQRQLQQAFTEMNNVAATCNVLLGGDLNLRDKDVSAVGGLPRGAEDVWVATGSNPETKYTWDMMSNDNLPFAGYRPRCRFDRFIFRPVSGTGSGSVKPILFQTVGRQRISKCGRYPSDHWGMLAHFYIAP